jgi:hypothetical protein
VIVESKVIVVALALAEFDLGPVIVPRRAMEDLRDSRVSSMTRQILGITYFDASALRSS